MTLRGGCAVAWLARDVETNSKVAIKQFSKAGVRKAEIESCRVEALIGSMLFKDKSADSERLENIARYFRCISDPKDLWLVHEVGGLSLSKHLFDIKG